MFFQCSVGLYLIDPLLTAFLYNCKGQAKIAVFSSVKLQIISVLWKTKPQLLQFIIF